MDGRRLGKWCVFGCLIAVAVGCNRSAQQGPWGQPPKDALPVTGVPMPSNAKSMWGGGSSAPNIPVEVAPEVSKKPASADARVAFANVQLDAAFDEKTAPGSREALLDTARQGYQKALKQEPKNKAALLGMAQFYARVGEREKAIEAYKKYLTIYPNDAAVAHEVAITYARWKDFPSAVTWCEHSLKLDPENRTTKKTMGFCLARAGRWDEAFAVLCQIMPEAQARHNLAGLLDHMGHTDASRIQLQLAMQADPTFAPARDFLTELNNPSPPTDPNAANPVHAAGGVPPGQ
jgi:tetratricopeptide (TPR) repeat protein